MRDEEVRGLVLEKFYEVRRTQAVVQLGQILSVLPGEHARVANICEQLAENGLIKWEALKSLNGTVGGVGKITAAGIDVIDGDAQPPFSITLHDHRVTVKDSTGVIIGDGNHQKIKIDRNRIEDSINQSRYSEEEKGEAKTLLGKMLGNPALWAALSGFFGFGGSQ